MSPSFGRGFSVPMTFSPDDPSRGHVDVGSAPRPSRSFCADGFFLNFVHGQIRVAFLQRRLDGAKIRSMLEIRMNIEPFKNWADTFHGTPDLQPESSDYFLSDFEEPDQTLAFEATLTRVAATGPSSVLDFYYVGPTEYTRPQDRGNLYIEEIVSLQFPNPMLPYLVKKVRDLSSQIQEVKHDHGQ